MSFPRLCLVLVLSLAAAGAAFADPEADDYGFGSRDDSPVAVDPGLTDQLRSILRTLEAAHQVTGLD